MDTALNVFNASGCVVCHRQRMIISDNNSLAELRSQKIQPFTDLLLHDMKSGLADDSGEVYATGSE